MSERLSRYVEKPSIFLIVVALIVGPAGCTAVLPPVQPSEPIDITTWAELDNIRFNLVGTYYLTVNLTKDMRGWAEVAGPDAHGGEGWSPIGVEFGQFRGHFYGMGNQICDLVINSERNEVGLFGYVAWPGSIDNVNVVNVTVNGKDYVGGVVGRNNADVTNCSSSGRVAGKRAVGGLVGWNDGGGKVSNSYSNSTCIVTGTEKAGNPEECVGGLVGWNMGRVISCSSNGSVQGTSRVGGLVGFNEGHAVEYSCSNGSVDGTNDVGGLVGWNEGKVVCSYSSGNVTGQDSVGGFVGRSYDDTIDCCYSVSNVTGTSSVGGLVGAGNKGSMVTDSYSASRVAANGTYTGGLVGLNNGAIVGYSFSTGGVTGKDYIGGLVGLNNVGTVSDSFWDKETSGIDVSSRGTGKTTAEMRSLVTFTGPGWNIVSVGHGQTDTAFTWNIVDGTTYPFLSWQPAA